MRHAMSSEILALHNQLVIKDQEVIALETQIQEIQTQLATVTKQKMSQPPNAGNNTVD